MTQTTRYSEMDNPYNEGGTINFRQYFHLLRRWLWLIILAGVIAGVAGYLLSRRMAPTYQTSTNLLVINGASNNLTDYNALLASEQLTSTYSEMLTNESVLQEVINKLNLSVSPAALADSIKVSPVRNTQLIEITVKGNNPGQIASIANTLVDTFINHILAIQSNRYSDAQKSFTDVLNQISNNIQDTKNQLQNTNDAAEKDRLQAQLVQYQQIYATLLSNYDQTRLAEAQSSANVVQLNPARPPATPVSPKVMQNSLLAALMAMILAISIIFGIETLDDTIKSPEQASHLTKLPILGVIAKHNHSALITQDLPSSMISEAFRALRANIQYANVDQPLRTIVVTSPSSMEGKTTVSMNLAITFAHAIGEEKVVLLDADLRHPEIDWYLEIGNDAGITSLLLEPEVHLNGSLQKSNTERLFVLPAGETPPNPMELLGSNKMSMLISQLKEQADIVIIDTAPILPVADALVLSTEVDGVLLVLRPGVTKVKDALEAVERLRRINARIIGLVLNNVDLNSQNYYYGSYFDKDVQGKNPASLRVLGNHVAMVTYKVKPKLRVLGNRLVEYLHKFNSKIRV